MNKGGSRESVWLEMIQIETQPVTIQIRMHIRHTKLYVLAVGYPANVNARAYRYWVRSRENLSSEVCDQVRFKLACSASEANWSWNLYYRIYTKCTIHGAKNKDTDQTARKIYVFAVRICHKADFLMTWLINWSKHNIVRLTCLAKMKKAFDDCFKKAN